MVYSSGTTEESLITHHFPTARARLGETDKGQRTSHRRNSGTEGMEQIWEPRESSYSGRSSWSRQEDIRELKTPTSSFISLFSCCPALAETNARAGEPVDAVHWRSASWQGHRERWRMNLGRGHGKHLPHLPFCMPYGQYVSKLVYSFLIIRINRDDDEPGSALTPSIFTIRGEGYYYLRWENWRLEFKLTKIVQLLGDSLKLNPRVSDPITPLCYTHYLSSHPLLSMFMITAWSRPSWALFKPDWSLTSSTQPWQNPRIQSLFPTGVKPLRPGVGVPDKTCIFHTCGPGPHTGSAQGMFSYWGWGEKTGPWPARFKSSSTLGCMCGCLEDSFEALAKLPDVPSPSHPPRAIDSNSGPLTSVPFKVYVASDIGLRAPISSCIQLR